MLDISQVVFQNSEILVKGRGGTTVDSNGVRADPFPRTIVFGNRKFKFHPRRSASAVSLVFAWGGAGMSKFFFAVKVPCFVTKVLVRIRFSFLQEFTAVLPK
jgi:hypothetical protein